MKTGKSTSKCTEGVLGHTGGKKKKNLHLLRYKTAGVFPEEGHLIIINGKSCRNKIKPKSLVT